MLSEMSEISEIFNFTITKKKMAAWKAIFNTKVVARRGLQTESLVSYE